MQAEMSQGPVSAETVSADFFTRLVALIIDSVIIGVPAFILMMILPVMLIYPLMLAASVGYQIYFWTTTGQTFGKMAMGLKVVSAETGNILTPSEAAPLAGHLAGGKPVLDRVLYWTNGHPYLTQRLCRAIADRKIRLRLLAAKADVNARIPVSRTIVAR